MEGAYCIAVSSDNEPGVLPSKLPEKCKSGTHNQWKLKAKLKRLGDRISQSLEAGDSSEGVRYRIYGYTDSIGSQRINLDFSKARAKAVLNSLGLKNELAKAYVTHAGRGELFSRFEESYNIPTDEASARVVQIYDCAASKVSNVKH